MRVLSLSLLIAAVLVYSPIVSAQSGTTTRIETRPVYGAVVTYESGVRVFRPIPPTQHMIINPDGQTPLILGVVGQKGHGGAGPGVMNQQVNTQGLGRRRGIQNIPAVNFPP